jgi:hypothetical protein
MKVVLTRSLLVFAMLLCVPAVHAQIEIGTPDAALLDDNFGAKLTVVRNEVHHVPWPLQKAEAEITQSSYFAAHGLDIARAAALLDFSPRVDVIAWNADRVG